MYLLIYRINITCILQFFLITDILLNLDSLLIQLQAEVTPKWYQFGEIVGIEKKVLDKCKQYSPEQSIIEILDNWLRNHAGQPTWREVAEALRKIGLQKLAFNIERVYDTGKLLSPLFWREHLHIINLHQESYQ